jgi:hypothetical protein
MVLHTDGPHPHVHVVVKAMGYDGKRLEAMAVNSERRC